MNLAAADTIAKAVLYEGYLLYPYRASSVKNQQRFNFGVLYPPAYSEAQTGHDLCMSQTECLVQGSATSAIEIRLRFLHQVDRSLQKADGRGGFCGVPRLEVDGKTYQAWQEAAEQELLLPETSLGELCRGTDSSFDVGAVRTSESIVDARGEVAGEIVRCRESIQLGVEATAVTVASGVFKLTVRVRNTTRIATGCRREQALMRSTISTHVILGAKACEFVSLIDPGVELRDVAAQCQNVGVFPILVGDAGCRDTIVASPIILYDYPEIAPESAGDLFDGTEIDEILSLRILTLTEQEKQEMRQSDERARAILDRTESLPAEQFMKLHGALRGLRPSVCEEPPRGSETR